MSQMLCIFENYKVIIEMVFYFYTLGGSFLSKQHELKTIIDQIINEFEIKIDDPSNIYSLLQELRNSELLTQAQFQRIAVTLVKETNQKVKCSLKINTLTKKALAIIIPNIVEGHYSVVFKI